MMKLLKTIKFEDFQVDIWNDGEVHFEEYDKYDGIFFSITIEELKEIYNQAFYG